MKILISAIAATLVASSSVHAQFLVARPNFGVPEIVQTGGTFKVEVKASAGLSAGQWSAVLANDLCSWTGAVEQVEYGTLVDNCTVSGYRLTVRVPSEIPPEVFKLAVSHSGPGGGAATNRNALSVVQCLETNFYVLHYTDIQVTEREPTNFDTGEHDRSGDVKGSVREVYWHAPAVNLINPRFMFHTGDELENAWPGGESNYELLLQALCTMKAPAFISRGNNDSTTTTDVWRRQLGVETYSFSMGSFYVCMKDYRENNFLSWFTNDYAASFTNPAIKYRLFGQHFNSGASQWMPPAGLDPDLMLVGHGHVNSTLQSSPYPVVETAAAYVKGAVGFFQFNRSADDWSCTIGSPWFQLMNSGPTSRIACAYSCTNDGAQVTNAAVIVNNIAKNFWDGRVRFLMQHSALGYRATGGTILSQYGYSGGTNTAVLVRVNIAPSATTTVSVFRVDADEDGMADDWEILNFGGTSVASAGTDYDDDGMSDWKEYISGTDPTNRQSVFAISDTVATGNDLVLQWSSVTGRTYSVYCTTNLSSGFSCSFHTGLVATPPVNTFTVNLVSAGVTNFFCVGTRQ